MYIQLSWRNIWRNPRRTGVILTAVVVGVWSMIFLGALMRGVSEQMVNNGIATLTGHIQIHQKDYRNDPVIENSMTETGKIITVLKNTLPDGSRWSPRIRVNAVASNARHSSGVTLVGIEPGAEAGVSFIGDAVRAGRYLDLATQNGIIVGQALLDKFDTRLGRKLVLMSQSVAGEIESSAFKIVGAYRAEIEATEKRFVFLNLAAARKMLKLKDEISEVSILLASRKDVDRVSSALKAQLAPDTYDIRTWQELLPLVIAILKVHDWFIFLWFIVVFIAMSFGIVNTTLMAVFERIREFGLLKALGMKPTGIVKGVLAECFFLLVIGLIVGNISGVLTVLVLASHGIDLSGMAAGMEYVGMSRIIFPVMEFKDVVLANLVVFFMGLLVSIYPAWIAARFNPVEAMAHN